jgi:hypothetical protein
MTDRPTPTISAERRAILLPLRIVTIRLRLAEMIRAGLAAIIAGLLAWGLCRLLGLVEDGLVAVAAGGSAAVCLAAGLHLQARRRPHGSTLALRIDRRAGFGEAYATAAELAASDADPGPVGRVLLRRTAPQLSTFDAGRIEPLITGHTRGLAGAAVLVGVLLWVLSGLKPTSLAPMAGADSLDAVKTATKEAESDGLERKGSYLETVAQAFRKRIAAAVGGQGDVPAGGGWQELLKHIGGGYDEQVAARSGPEYATERPQAAAGLGETATSAERAQAQSQSKGTGASSSNTRSDDLAARKHGSGKNEAAASDSAAEGNLSHGSSDPNSAGSNQLPGPREKNKFVSAGHTSAGAAMNSGKGKGSDVAGFGTQELAEDDRYAAKEIRPSEDFVVTTRQTPGGKRFRVELAPKPETGPRTQEPAGAGSTVDSGSPITPARSFVPPNRLALVARYLAHAPQ